MNTSRKSKKGEIRYALQLELPQYDGIGDGQGALRSRLEHPYEICLLRRGKEQIGPPLCSGESSAQPKQNTLNMTRVCVLLGRGMGAGARTHKVVSLVALLQLVSTLRILREHRSRDVIKSRVLAVFGSMFRC
jgi:hypothetical protein